MLKRFYLLLSFLILIFCNNLSSSEILQGFTTFFTFDKVLLTRNTNLFMLPEGHVKLDNGYSFDVGISRIERGALEIGGQFGYRVEKQKLKDKAVIQYQDPTSNTLVQATIQDLSYQNQMMNLLMKVGLNLSLGDLTPYVGGLIGVSRVKLLGDVVISASPGGGSSLAVEKKINSDAMFKIAYGGEAGLIVPFSPEIEAGIFAQYFGLFNITKKDIYKDKIQDKDLPDSMKIKTGEWSIKGMIRFLA